MMGPRQEAQPALFYGFSLEDHVPQEHLLLSNGRFVNLSSIRAHLADVYSHTGRPFVDLTLDIARSRDSCGQSTLTIVKPKVKPTY